MNDKIILDKQRRENARWVILRMLYAGRPIGASEAIIQRVLQDVGLDHTIEEVRREFDYLGSLGLAEVGEDELVGWYARLTAPGVALVEYNAPAPPGIARPRKSRGER